MMRFVRAVGAGLVLVGLVVGLPVVLWYLGGSPVPEQLPEWEQVRGTLSRPDTTGQVLWVVLKAAGWVAWATFAVSTVTELAAQVGRRPAPRLRGLGLQQRFAAGLVAAVLGLATAPAALAVPVQALSPVAAPAAVSVEAAASVTAVPLTLAGLPVEGVDQAAAPQETAAGAVHTVQDGDSLWKIAQERLGDPHRWREIYALNAGVVQADGYALGDAGWVDPGWQLVLPADAQAPPAVAEHTRTVQPGDTLSQIAADELGDAARYPEIFQASAGTEQSDGRHLVDPDLIYPGWDLTIPETVTPGVPADPAQTPPEPGEPAGPSAQVQPETANQVEGQAADPSGPAEALEPETVTGQASPRRTGQDTSRPGGVQDQVSPAGVPEWAPWVLTGLTGAGAVLAGSLWLLLRARRRAQRRHRRPGRTLAAPGPLLAPVDKTLVTVGPGTAGTVDYLDAVLRRLGAVVTTSGESMPDLVAVELTGTHVVLHLGGPWQLGAPWEGDDDGHQWQVPVGLDLDRVGPAGDHPAPYPLLVTMGTSDDGGVWLFNMEDLTITLTGDDERARDFARYLVAEIGCSPWAAWSTVDCVGLGAELVGLNPDRIRYHHPGDGSDPVGKALAEAMDTVVRATLAGTDVVTARSAQVGVESWSPQVVLVDATSGDPALAPLLDLVADRSGQTGTSVVVAGSRPDTGGVRIEVGDDGRVVLPEVGLDLVAVRLDITEAAGCAGLVAHADTALGPVPVPSHDDTDTGWRVWSDMAGALLPEHTAPRLPSDNWHDPQTASSVLPAADEAYLQAAATTREDLAALAPQVPVEVRDQVEAADPRLDADLTAWFAPGTACPRVRVLGPVQVAAAGTPPTRRQPFYAELVAFLALHPGGVTPSQVAETFSVSRGKAREYLRIACQWLGADPHTGEPYLCEEDQDDVCRLQALVDLDLLRRLRVRGQARGEQGVDDLLAALRLVAGRPFDGLRAGGWAWLAVERIDETALVAVVDTAHTVVTYALATADLTVARRAAETAQVADPDDEIIRLDLAAVASAEGRYAEASQIVVDEICNRSDDENAPVDLSTRTQEILAVHPGWGAPRRAS